jgi:uncharacterized SAM-binding protein YcdF (DUF218 family)
MFELLSLALLVSIIIAGVGYVIKNIVPTATLALLGGIVLLAIPLALLLLPGDQTVIAGANLAILYLLGNFLYFAIKQKVPSRWAIVSLVAVLLFSLPLVSNAIVQLEESGAVRGATALSQESGTIVLLGRGATRANFRPTAERAGVSQIQVGALGDRIPYTAQLFRSLNQPLVIVTGGARKPRVVDRKDGKDETVNEGNDIRSLLITLAVPPEQIIVEPDGVSFVQIAEKVEKILTAPERGLPKRIVLVASAADLPIAKATFQRRGFTVAAAPTDFQVTFASGSTRRMDADTLDKITDIIPNPEALARSVKVLGHALRNLSLQLRMVARMS